MIIKLYGGSQIGLEAPYSIEFTEDELSDIRAMPTGHSRWSVVPDTWSAVDIDNFRGKKVYNNG